MTYIPTAAPIGSDDLHLDQFEPDDADWYIEERALARGLDPSGLVRSVRHVQSLLAPTAGDHREAGLRTTDSAVEPSLAWPPGRSGRFARFIFDQSYSPVREVAVAATLGLLAGVCGRGYRTYTGKDLALYIILIARSGIGKDSTHDCLPMMLELAPVPFADRFVRSQDFVSGEALHKELLREPGFLALQGEFGRKLKRMANPGDAPMQNLRTVMTNAYGKRHLEGKSYSNAENSLLGVDWPALSFLGETTPSTFLECLTADMMADGFLSRFLSVTYAGDRPLPNRDRTASLDEDDLSYWRALLEHMVRFQDAVNWPAPCTVEPNDDAREKLERYEIDCIEALNRTEDESERQVWSRAHLKVLKVASLLAVADNCFGPVVRIEHVAWARTLIEQDIATFQSRKRSGDIGLGDDAREGKVISLLRDYLLHPPKPGYKIPKGMPETSIVPRSYLQMRTATLPAFANHRLGSAKALDEALRSLVDSGWVMEVDKLKVIEAYSYHGKAYRILKLPD